MEYIWQKCDWDVSLVFPIMAVDGKASCWMYSPKDDPGVITFENLFVSQDVRKEGRGHELLSFCEKVAMEHGFYKIDLRVERDSWIQKWYEREGYEQFGPDPDEPMKYMWLEKYMSDEARKKFLEDRLF